MGSLTIAVDVESFRINDYMNYMEQFCNVLLFTVIRDAIGRAWSDLNYDDQWSCEPLNNDTPGLQRDDSADSAIYENHRGEGVGVEGAATAEGPNGRMSSTSTQSLNDDAFWIQFDSPFVSVSVSALFWMYISIALNMFQ